MDIVYKYCISVTHAIVCVIGRMGLCVQAICQWPSFTQWSQSEWLIWFLSTHINISNREFISSAMLAHWFLISWKLHKRSDFSLSNCDSSDEGEAVSKNVGLNEENQLNVQVGFLLVCYYKGSDRKRNDKRPEVILIKTVFVCMNTLHYSIPVWTSHTLVNNTF